MKIVRQEAAIVCKSRAGIEYLDVVVSNRFARHGQRRNDVGSGAAASDEYAQLRQAKSSQEGFSSGFVSSVSVSYESESSI